jgi:hypothetical protein
VIKQKEYIDGFEKLQSSECAKFIIDSEAKLYQLSIMPMSCVSADGPNKLSDRS